MCRLKFTEWPGFCREMFVFTREMFAHAQCVNVGGFLGNHNLGHAHIIIHFGM